VEKRVRESKFSDAAWMAAYEKNDAKGMAAAEDAIAERIRGRATAQPPAAAASATAPRRPASAPVNTNSTRAANPAKVEGLPPGSVVRGNEVYDAAGKLIGHVR
jgi:hypothetical protein